MEIDKDIEIYEKVKEELEASHNGQWVLIREAKIIAFYSSFEEAANEAVRQFGAGPYLIRQVGAPSILLPASVMYIPVNG